MNLQPSLEETRNPQYLLNERHQWFSSTAGQYLLAKEQALYDQAVFDLFGFNALQLGCLPINLLRNSRIPNRYRSCEFDAPAFDNHLCCSDDYLPFAEMSLDLLLMPHCLEFSEHPHQALREAERVMMPEGHLLISGFNPLSAWGAVASLNRTLSGKKRFPWNGQLIGLSRMKDWLALLGFEILSVEMCCHVPPFEQAAWHKRFVFMDKAGERCCSMLGGVYFILARKRVAGMTPIKPNWKHAPLKSSLVTRPTQSRPTQKDAENKN